MAADYFLVRKGATALPNRVIHSSLSFPALGVLTYALSLPESAPKGYRQFMDRGMGKTALLGALKELEEAGLRFRFRARRAGQFRDVIVFADSPSSPGEVYEEILAQVAAGVRGDLDIVSCPSHPDFTITPPAHTRDEDTVQNRRSHRGAEISARPENVTQDTENGSVEPVDKVHRGEENRARLSGAHISKDISNSSSLRSDEMFHPTTPESRSAQPVASAQFVDGVDGRIDWELLRSAIPTPLVDWIYSGRSAQICTQAITQLLERGWTHGRIYRRLNSIPVPAEVANPPGLAIHRVRSLLGEPVPKKPTTPAPAREGREVEAVSEEVRLAEELAQWEVYQASENELLADMAARQMKRITARLAELAGTTPKTAETPGQSVQVAPETSRPAPTSHPVTAQSAGRRDDDTRRKGVSL